MSNARTVSKTFPGRKLLAVDVSGGNVTPATPPRLFYVGGAGDVVVIAADDSASVTITSGDNQYHPIEVKTFVQTGTTATGIVAVY